MPSHFPLAGVRVLELGIWVAAPATGSLLADWGASVTKIESPAGGDPLRGIVLPGMEAGANPWFDSLNRGKRSISVDLRNPAGRRLTDRLLSQTDVFIINIQSDAARRLGMDPETVRAAHPRLIYCRITGYGPRGADANRPSFDGGAFWARSGFMATMALQGGEPPTQPVGIGDLSTGMAAAGAIAAALFKRERSGEGALVDISLYRTGIYVMGWNIAGCLRNVPPISAISRRAVTNALYNIYQAGDGVYFFLTNNVPDPYWPGLCAAIDRPDLVGDPRFADFYSRGQHSAELVLLLDEIFATRTRAEWGKRFDAHGVIWAEAQTVPEITADPQAAENNAWISVSDRAGHTVRMPAGPADFDGMNSPVTEASPEPGEHTEQVLLDLGYSWENIAALKEGGAIP